MIKLSFKSLKLKETTEKINESIITRGPLVAIITQFHEDPDLDNVIKSIKKLAIKNGPNHIYPVKYWLNVGGTLSAVIYLIGVQLKQMGGTQEEYDKLFKLLKEYDFNGSFTKRAVEHWPTNMAIDLTASIGDKIKKGPKRR